MFKKHKPRSVKKKLESTIVRLTVIFTLLGYERYTPDTNNKNINGSPAIGKVSLIKIGPKLKGFLDVGIKQENY